MFYKEQDRKSKFQGVSYAKIVEVINKIQDIYEVSYSQNANNDNIFVVKSNVTSKKFKNSLENVITYCNLTWKNIKLYLEWEKNESKR